MCDFMIALQKPFPAEDIEWRVGSTNADKTKGIALAYITNRAIMSRLDELFGPFGWRNEYREWKGSSQLCGISIKHEGEWITKWDGADDSQTEAVKGGLSDAMKRAGYQWGIGRYLYNLDNVWVPIRQQGKSYVLASEPKLPHWALPEGYEQKIKENIPADESIISVTDDDLNALDKATEEFVNKPIEPKANKTTPTATNGQSTKKSVIGRVYDLREELNWEWKDLNNFASDVLQREIKYLKTGVKSDEEWIEIEKALLVTKAALQKEAS